MKLRAILALILALSLLTGCSWMDTGYVSVTPHREQSGNIRTENLVVSNYDELLEAMEAVVSKGTENSIINVVNYDAFLLEENLPNATYHIRKIYPIGAYAVEELNCELGSNTGKTAIALAVFYIFYRLMLSKDTFHRY